MVQCTAAVSHMRGCVRPVAGFFHCWTVIPQPWCNALRPSLTCAGSVRQVAGFFQHSFSLPLASQARTAVDRGARPPPSQGATGESRRTSIARCR
ncbi:hypothetical protein PMIN06_011802 [Paraphaeosphaeria minitans]